MAMTTEKPNEENIKCVIVGDNNVGKTRLVCARAYKQYEPNNQYARYGSTHIPTVWANDHYRNDENVLNKARENIDGVSVSLRLWDTFGDHSKNRKFSYGRADVVIICFSVCDRNSLNHVKGFWMPEVRRHCKGVPVILVGCKIDLRFANLEDLNKQKTTLAKKIKSDDILFPGICRQAAFDIECPYYETSICKGYGIKEVFENAVRAALTYRRKLYLYRNVHLRHVQKPFPQKPLTPPKPRPPVLPTKVAETSLNFSKLYNDPTYSDLVIVGSNFKFYAHKVVLAISSKVFQDIFLTPDDRTCFITVSDDGERTSLNNSFEDQKVPDLSPLKNQNDYGSCEVPDFENDLGTGIKYDFVTKYTMEFILERNCNCNFLYLTSDISGTAFMDAMHFCYMGYLSSDVSTPSWLKENIQIFSDLFTTSRLLGLTHMSDLLTRILNEESGPYNSIEKFDAERKLAMRDIILSKQHFSDIEFETDDGTVPGHKGLLVCGSDMMSAMFGSDCYVESGNKAVAFPETTAQSLQIVFEYIYTKNVTLFGNSTTDFNDIIALANRLCLPDLIHIAELQIIKDLKNQVDVAYHVNVPITRELHESIVLMLEVAQLHNAHNLAEWCVHHIITNYNDVCKKCKFIRCLSQENQDRLEQYRWPPVWFIKEYDAYERACRQRSLEENYQRGKSSRK